MYFLKTGSCHDTIFVVASGNEGCCYDNLGCHQWRQSWHHENYSFATSIYIAKKTILSRHGQVITSSWNLKVSTHPCHTLSYTRTWIRNYVSHKTADVITYSLISVPATGFKYITMTSQWARWRLKSPASRVFAQPFIQAQIKENIKTPRHWPLWGESSGDGWIPLTKGQ